MEVYEHLSSQANVHLTNTLPNSIKNTTTAKALKILFFYDIFHTMYFSNAVKGLSSLLLL